LSIRLAGDARAEWQQHWPTVIAAMAGVAMSPINSYSVGVFIQPLQDAFGWSRAEISLGPALTAPVIILMASLMGVAIDRYGPRRIGIIGVISLFVLNIALSAVGPSIWSWWAVWAMLAVANLFIQPSVWTAAISGMFSAGRGFALALTLCGSGIGSIITPFLTYELILRFGWRMGFIGLAGFWGIITIPLVYFLFTSLKDRARMAPVATLEAPISPAVPGAGRRQLLSWRFLRLALAGWIIASVVMSLVMNLVPVLSWNGLTRAQAAGVAPLLGVASIAGRLLIGFFLDRVSGTLMAALSVCLPIGTALDLVAYLTSRYFGLRNFGLLFGTIGGLITLAGAVTPLAMNMVYDATQSYAGALWVYIPACLVSALLFLSLGAYPRAEEID